LERSWGTQVDLSSTKVALEKTDKQGEGVESKVKEEDKFQLEIESLDTIW
jgi:hypothetical protein